MVSKAALKKHFLTLGIDVKDDATLDKCLDLCDVYAIDEEELVDTWMAHSITHFGGADPTVQSLGHLERYELKKDNILPVLQRKESNLATIAVHNAHSSKTYTDNDDILEMYGGKQPTTPKAKRLRSPEFEAERQETKIRAVESPFSPSTFSPKTTTPSRYSTTANRGKILTKFGKDLLSWKNEDKVKVEITKTDDPHVPSNATYMLERLVNKAACLDMVCQDLGEALCEIFKETDESSQLTPQSVGTRAEGKFQTYGRICCDAEGKLNGKSMLLEGSKNLSIGQRMKLDVSNVQQVSMFPGQIVAVEGVNPTGNILVANKLFFETYPQLAEVPKVTTDLHIVVAAGPFTLPDNLCYQPLTDLVEYVVENEPHVLLLIGPFIDFAHPEIQSCEMAETFQEFFEEKIVENIMQPLRDTCTQVIIVPSHRDVHHEPIYPTPEFFLRNKKWTNLHLMPDPCMLDIQGLIIGTTSIDTLMHIGCQEFGLKSDKLSRLATHVLAQRCFYPLVPPSEEVNVDTELWEKYAFMDQKPHLLILPSNLQHFCKDLNNCIVLNPARLAKGSFARLKISPTKNGVWDTDHVACQVLKV